MIMDTISRWIRKVFRIPQMDGRDGKSPEQKMARAARIKSYQVAHETRNLEERMNAMEGVLLCGGHDDDL